MISGSLTISSGDTRRVIKAGELVRYNADVPHSICNLSTKPASAWLTVLHV